jgi:sigma-E factor negative regulatory protein RseC
MIEQKAKVIKRDDKAVWVEAERQSTCSQCQVKQGCGTGMLSEHVGKRFSQLRAPAKGNIDVGQEVNVHIPESALLSGAFLVYLLPLITLFLSSFLIRWLGYGELLQISFGLLGLILGFWLASQLINNKPIDITVQLIEETE